MQNFVVIDGCGWYNCAKYSDGKGEIWKNWEKMEQMFDLCCEYVYTLSFDYDILA